MHVAPLATASISFAQNVSDPALWAKVQHMGAPDSVHCEAALQRRTTFVPEQSSPPRLVAHWPAGLHATLRLPVVQFGIEPPVTGMSPQQTSPPAQS
jgi:hypothetical protein